MLVGSYPICCLISQGSKIKFQLQSQFNIWCGKIITHTFNIAVCSIFLFRPFESVVPKYRRFARTELLSEMVLPFVYEKHSSRTPQILRVWM